MPSLLRAFFIVTILGASAGAVTYHFSSSGDDSRTALQAQNPSTPWKSLSKIGTLTLAAGDSVLLQRGDTLEGTIELSRSGSPSDPLVIGAFGTGDPPVVSGARAVSGWTSAGGSVYSAAVDTVVTQVFCDGAPMVLARYPNRGYFTIDSVIDNSRFIDTDFSAPGALDGAWVHARTIRWTIESVPLGSYSAGSRLFTLPAPTGYDLLKGWGFFLNNARALLDTAGEWFCDSAAKRLYVRTPQSDAPGGHRLLASVHPYGVRLNGCSYVTVENLTVAWQAVSCVRASGRGVVIRNVRALYADSRGIDLSGAQHLVSGDTVAGANHYGIVLYGDSCVVERSAILRTGMFYRMNRSGIGGMCCKGRGLDFGGTGNRIAENRIDSTGYIAIGFAGQRSLVEKNWITNTCMTVDDGSGIYTWSSDFAQPGSENTVIRNNIVVNSLGNGDGTPEGTTFANGIYMDDRIHDVEIYGNTCVNCDFGLFLHNNRNVNAHDNICYDNRSLQIAVQRDAIVDQAVYGNTVTGNVMYNLEPSQACFAFREYAANGQPLASVQNNICCGEREARCDRDAVNLWKWQSSYAIIDSVGGNLITNGGFDAATTGWGSWPSSNARSFVAGAGYDGGALRVQYTGGSDTTPIIISNSFAILRDSTYALFFAAKGVRRGSFGVVAREDHSAWATVGVTTSVSLDTAWQAYTIIFKGVIDEPQARIDFVNQRPDSVVWLDAVSLYRVHALQDDYRGLLFTNETGTSRILTLTDGAYRTVEGAAVTAPVTVLPFTSVVLVRESAVTPDRSVPGRAGSAAWTVQSVRRWRGEVLVRLSGSATGPLSVALVDALGRTVARRAIADPGCGEVRLAAPGRSGVLLLRVSGRGRTLTQRVCPADTR